MGLIHFDTEAYPLEQRSAAWREALRCCGIASTLPSAAPRGDFLALTSRQGCRFVQINAGPQDLTWEEANRDLWLSFLLEGSGLLPDGTPLRPQDLCIGTMAKPGGVTLTEPFRLLLIVLPVGGLDDRLRRMEFVGGHVTATHGMGRVLTGFLETIAETIRAVDPAQLHPLELSLSELLIAALTGTEAPPLAGGIDRRRSTFQRLMQAIEARLPDTALNLVSLASSEGMSVRAVQKLLQRENLSFSQYVRRRRVQHAAQDLLDLQQSKLLVADIGFRWGFSDPAHFSRAFREQYGVTPGTFREQNFTLAATGTRRPHPRTTETIGLSQAPDRPACDRRRRGRSTRQTGNGPAGRCFASPPPAQCAKHPLGLFQQIPPANPHRPLRRHCHHRDADSACHR